MKEFLDIYDIEINNDIKIEALYTKKPDFKDASIFLEDKENNKLYEFKVLDKLYDKDSSLMGYRIMIRLNYNDIGNYKIVIKEGNKKYSLNWCNNQNIALNFNENEYKIFANNKEISLINDGISIKNKTILSKLTYNFKKNIYGVKKYHKLFLFRLLKFKSKYILINDRVSEGNDNGEALFKYVRTSNNELKKNTYYVVKKDSKTYDDLKKYGHVLKYGSFKHKYMFLNSKVIASAYIGNSKGVYNPFNNDEMDMYRDLINKKTVFLQHGIMMTDLHLMFNRARMVIDKFIVTTRKEKESIQKQGYLYDEDMLMDTGLPRYDLLKRDDKNKILLSFTWRKWLTNLSKEEFMKSKFYIKMKSLIGKEMNDLLKKYDYYEEIVIHSELNNYIDCFRELENSNIKIFKSTEVIYSELFNSSKMLITDYSSIHYDMAYLKRPIIYFQFDLKDFLTKHTNNGDGGYDYCKDGFGDVVKNKEDVFKLVEEYIKNDFEMKEKYKKRVDDSFLHNDNDNSLRVCEHIYEITKESSKNYRFNNVQ